MPQYPYAPGNSDLGALVTLTAASASGNTMDLTNGVGRGVRVNVNITALTGTSPTLTVTIQGKDAASGTYYTILASTALSATGFTRLTIYPGLTAAANSIASDIVPRDWRIAYTIGGTTPAVTATIGAEIAV